MQQQIVHEAEVHRQHVRLKIPIGVEIDGTRYTVDDWSLGGFGVTRAITSRQPGEQFSARLAFPFEDFELSMRLECQMVYVTPESDRFGCKFLVLSQGQMSLFRYVVDAYLSGEIVAGGDILNIVGRDNTAEARAQDRLFGPFLEEATAGRRWHRRLGLLLLALFGIGLVALIGLGYRERFLVVEIDNAVVEAPVFRVKTATTGTVTATVDPQKILHKGDPVASIEAAGAPPVALKSPCECVVHDWVVPAGDVAQAGGLVAVLVAADRPLVVRAEVAPDQAQRLRTGQPAEITLIGRPGVVRGQVAAVDARVPLVGGDPLAGRSHPVTLIIRPDTPFDFDDLGRLATVRLP